MKLKVSESEANSAIFYLNIKLSQNLNLILNKFMKF